MVKAFIKRKRVPLLAILVLLLGLGTYFYWQHTNQKVGEIVAGSFLPDEKDAKKMSEKELQNLADKKVDESKFTLKIYPEAQFEDGKSEGNIYIKNESTNAFPIAVQLFENKTKDLLYDSGAIQPGYEITKGKLEKELKKGTYNCTAKVSIFDAKSKKFKGQTEAAVQLTIKN